MKPVIAVSGPHGGGKTYMIDSLLLEPHFVKSTYELDFLSQLKSLESLADWERSLIRLYHRHFVTTVAEKREADGTCMILSRGVLDSAAYIEAYWRLGWIEAESYKNLRRALDAIPSIPPSVLLVPPLDLLLERLRERINRGVRSDRDQVFRREDSNEFVGMIHDCFAEFGERPGVLLLENNEVGDREKLAAWVKQ